MCDQVQKVSGISNFIITQIESATTDVKFREVLSKQAVCDAVIGCGISKPLAQLTTVYKDEIKKLICLRDVFFDSKSAIDQFKAGLDEVRSV